MQSYDVLLQDVRMNAEVLKTIEEERMKILESTEKLRIKYVNEEEAMVSY